MTGSLVLRCLRVCGNVYQIIAWGLALTLVLPTISGAGDGPISSALVPDGCPNVTGRYEFIGKAEEGFSEYYRALKSPLTLDRLLGGPYVGGKYAQVTTLEIQGDNHLILVLRDPQGIVAQYPFGRAEDLVHCDGPLLRLDQEVAAGGDGAHNDLKITRVISRIDAQGIRVVTTIRGTGRFLFFFSYDLPPEEYRAVFLAK